MFVRRRIPTRVVLSTMAASMSLGAGWAAIVFALYSLLHWKWLAVPFLPIGTIGTAVAFYVGFKNNSAYERFWEGRKIWGGIVNDSRTLGTHALAVLPGDDLAEARSRILHRHLAWVNALRLQLRAKSRFIDNGVKAVQRRLTSHAEHMRNDWEQEVAPFLTDEEVRDVRDRINPAVHILKLQEREFETLYRNQKLDLFDKLSLMDLVREYHALQGKCERIKNTPFPRQYAEFSRLFVRAFVLLAPLGLIRVFGLQDEFEPSMLLNLIPMMASAGAITWVFVTMEGIGDASEDPFERSMSDVPMNALSRTIERDLRDLLDEKNIPAPEKPVDHLLY